LHQDVRFREIPLYTHILSKYRSFHAGWGIL